MNANKTNVYATYDTHHKTWNAMSMDNKCIFYGSIHQLENWLEENKEHYQEVKIIGSKIYPVSEVC